MQALRNPDEPLGRPAATALLGFGAAAVPALKAALSNASTAIRGGALQVLARLGPDAEAAVPEMLKALGDEEADVRWAAARALGAVGHQVETVAPALAALLADESATVRGWAALALGGFSAAAVPVLIPALAQKLPRVRAAAAEALAYIGSPAFDATAALGGRLKDDEADVRLWADRALSAIGRDVRPATAPLLALLGDDSDAYREWAVLMLLPLGAPAVPPLLQALVHAKPRVRWGAADALGQLGTRAEAAIPLLITCLADADELVQERVARALGEIGQASVTPLIEALRRPELGVRIGAVDALSRIGAEAAAAVPPLLDLLKSEDHLGLQRFIAEALGQIGPAAVQALADAFLTASPDIRARLAQALGVVGAAARAAVPTLQQAIRHDDFLVRRAALWALGRIAPSEADAPTLLADVVEAVEDADPTVREQAALTLGRLGPQTLQALPQLLEGLRSPDAARRQTAALAVGEVFSGGGKRAAAGDARRIALAALTAVVREDASVAVRGQALRALAAVAPDAGADDLPASVQGLEDADWFVQARAVDVLTGVGAPAEPLLRSALRKSNPLVRRAALAALMRLEPADLVELLSAHLTDKDWQVAQIAAEGLAAAGERAWPAVAALDQALSSPLNVVREAALKALQPLDPDGKGIIPGLIEALKTRSRPAQAWAAEQLGKYKEKAAAATPLLIGLMRRWRGGVSSKASAAIREIGAGAVPHLIAAITQPDEEARKHAFNALSSIHYPTYSALQPFRQQLAAPPPDVLAKISESLAAFAGGTPSNLQNLRTRLKDRGNWRTRYDAAIGLGKMGKDAAPAVQDLVTALRDSDSDVREKSAEALGLIGDASAAPALVDKLNDANEKVRLAAMLSLGRLGQSAPTTLDPLVKLIGRDNNPAETQRLAAQLLSSHGPRALPALPRLVLMLGHEDHTVRLWAAWALGQIGPPAREAAAEPLRRTLDDPHPRVQAWAMGAYHRVTGKVEPILPVLVRVLPCREPDVRNGVLDAARRAGAAAQAVLRKTLNHPDARYRTAAQEVNERLGAAEETLEPVAVIQKK
jgi:HEAT repeat protein